MARLIDEILLHGVKPFGEFETEECFYDTLEQAEVLKIDNVSDYFFAGVSEDKEWGPDDFPNLAPPFKFYWMESRGINTKMGGDVFNITTKHGVLFRGFELTSEHLQELASAGGQYPTSARWFVGWEAVIEDPRSQPTAICGGGYIVNSDGTLVPDSTRFILHTNPEAALSAVAAQFPEIPYEAIESRLDERLQIMAQGLCFTFLYPAMLATSFLHCKNVTTTPGVITSKWAAKYKRKTGRDLVQFKTLDIGPVTRVLQDAGVGDKGTGLKKALHIARGHFATYTPEKPLFGRHAGRFWVPQHIRGRSSEGVVVKNYKVKTGVTP